MPRTLLKLPGFQSTLPMRGATQWALDAIDAGLISIHAPHAGSDHIRILLFKSIIISIHAPHAGSDDMGLPSNQYLQISIHAPHAGSDRDLLIKWTADE